MIRLSEAHKKCFHFYFKLYWDYPANELHDTNSIIVSSKTSWELSIRIFCSKEMLPYNWDFIKAIPGQAWSRGAKTETGVRPGRHNWFLSQHWASLPDCEGAPASLFTNLGPAFYIKIISNFRSLPPSVAANVFKNRRIRKKIYFTAICWLGWVKYFERCINHWDCSAQYLTNLCLMFAAAGAFQTLFWQNEKYKYYIWRLKTPPLSPAIMWRVIITAGVTSLFAEGGNGDIRDITGMEIMIMRT